MADRQDRRVARTRNALIEAFNDLVLYERQRKIGVRHIVARANVGRSTFYEHYSSAEAIQLEAMSGPLAILADAAAGQGDAGRLATLLAHFWDNRQWAREAFPGRMGYRVTRLLAAMVEERLQSDGSSDQLPKRLAALQLAEAALAPIRGWVSADASCSSEVLARSICRCGEQMRTCLTEANSAS